MNGLRASLSVLRRSFAVEVSLEVAPGKTLAIMGPSGAGKSTLLAALAGLEPLTTGEVVVGDRVVERAEAPAVRVAPMQRGVILLGQDPRLFPHLSALENVAFGPRARGIPRRQARETAAQWLERVGLPDAGSRRPAELSGGEQQRVAVARALAAGPDAVLLDEPLVALDPETAAEIRGMLRAQLAGTTVVAVTHDAVDAVALADHLMVIERGRVTQSGPVRDVLARPASRFVASVAGLNRVPGMARAGGWERDGVRLEPASPIGSAVAADGTPLAAVFRPSAVRLVEGPGGERNEWESVVERWEPTPAGVRLHAGWCVVDVEAGRADGLEPGSRVVLSLDPADLRLQPG